ncbi:MAG: hypothetical protein WC834_00045 [Eubacteriales bacterium]
MTDGMVSSGVEGSVAAGQTSEGTQGGQGVQTTQESTAQVIQSQGTQGDQQAQEDTGVEQQPAAVVNEAVEKAFAARLKEATEKVKQEAVQEARDTLLRTSPVLSYVEQLAKDNGMTAEDFIEWDKQQKEQMAIDEIARTQEIPAEVAQELVEARKIKAQAQATQQAQQVNSRIEAEGIAFIKAFPGVEAKDIPKNVWDEVYKGKSLVGEYAQHELQLLRQKIQAGQVNQDTANASPGSITGNGPVANVALTEESIANMTDNERIARWPEIKKALGMK